MEKTCKRLLSFAVALVMVIGLLPPIQFEAKAAAVGEPLSQTTGNAEPSPYAGVLDADATGILENKWCEACQAYKTWVPIPQCTTADGTKPEYLAAQLPVVKAGDEYHYYVPQNKVDGVVTGVTNNTKNINTKNPDKPYDISAAGNSYFFLYMMENGKVCLHLNGSKLSTANNAHVASGTLNVMGDGEWTGYYNSNGRGTTIHHHGSYGYINLYSGTFKSGVANRSPISYGAGDMYIYSGACNIKIYDPVRIEGDVLARSGNIFMYGGTITGRVIVAAYQADVAATATAKKKVYYPTFTYEGGTILGGEYGTTMTEATIAKNGGKFFVKGGTLNINGGVLTGMGTEEEPFLYNGGLIYAETSKFQSTTININGGTLNGGVVEGKNGGAVCAQTSTDGTKDITVNINGATITGGKAIPATTLDGDKVKTTGGYGGNVYTSGAVLNLGASTGGKNTVISGGEAYWGGNICHTNTGSKVLRAYATVQITGGKAVPAVYDDTHSAVDNRGGNIYAAYSTSVYGEVSYGEAQGGLGGNLCVTGASLTVTSSANVHHGTAGKGGNIYSSWKLALNEGSMVADGTANVGGNIYYDDSSSHTAAYNQGTENKNSGMNFYGTITRGTATTGQGGNIYSAHKNQNMNILAGEVSDGKCLGTDGNISRGGNIYSVAGGAVNIGNAAGGTAVLISGGEAQVGGSIYSNNVVVKKTGTVRNGVSRTYGGNIASAATVTIYGVVENGLAKTHGGNIAAAGGYTTTIDGGIVRNGKAYVNGGNINSNNDNLVIKNNSIISGGIANYKPEDGSNDATETGNGGNIRIFGGPLYGLTLESGKIIDGQALGSQSKGGNISVFKNGVYGGSFTMYGGEVSGGSAPNGDDIAADDGAGLTINGGVIGKESAKDKTALYVRDVVDQQITVNDVTMYGTVDADETITKIEIYHGKFTIDPTACLAADAVVYKNGDMYEVHVKGTAGNTVPNDCFGDGYTEYTCGYSKVISDTLTLTCTDTFQADAVPAAHTMTKQTGMKATCLDPGYKDYWYCEVCGAMFEDEACTKPIEDFVVWMTGDGKIEKLEHSYTGDNKVCVNGCEMTQCDNEGHDWQSATCTVPKTCSRCEQTDGEALGHVYDPETGKCTNGCGLTKCEAEGHEWGAEIEAKQPNCTEKGNVAYYHCDGCGKYAVYNGEQMVITDLTDIEIGIDPKAHAYNEKNVCVHCGKGWCDINGHSWGDEIAASPANCVQSGNVAYYACGYCGAYAVGEEKTIVQWSDIVTSDPNNHNYPETWTEDGENHKKVCANDPEHVITEAHSFTYAPTGIGTCVCGATKNCEHTFEYTPNNDATCEADGTKSATCPTCKQVSTVADEGSKLGHDYKVNGVYNETQHQLVCDNDDTHITWENHDGNDTCVCGFVAKTYVAYIDADMNMVCDQGEARFETLAEAIAAVPEDPMNPTVVGLLADIELTESTKISANKVVMLNMLGFDITGSVVDEYGMFYVSPNGVLMMVNYADETSTVANDSGYAIGNFGMFAALNVTISGSDAALYNFYFNGSIYGKANFQGATIDTIWNCGELEIDAETQVAYLDNSGYAKLDGTVAELYIGSGEDAPYVPNAGVIAGDLTGVTVDYDSENYDLVSENGETKLVAKVFVAEVDGTKYESLAEAVAAVDESAEIKLLDNVTLTEQLTIRAGITLNLNGFTITGNVAGEPDYGMIYVSPQGGLWVQNGTVSNEGGITIGNYGFVKVEATATVLSDEENAALYNFFYSANVHGMATVEGKANIIWNCGDLVIAEGAEVAYLDNSGIVDVKGAVAEIYAQDGSDCAGFDGAGTLTIADTSKITVDEDYKLVQVVEGVYKVVAKTYVVDTTLDRKFESLQEAIATAIAEDMPVKITLLDNIELTESITISGTVGIEMNGYNITGAVDSEYGMFYVRKDAELIFYAEQGTGTVSNTGSLAIGNYGYVRVNNGVTVAGADAALYNFYFAADYYGRASVDGTMNVIWNCGKLSIQENAVVEYLDNSGYAEDYGTVAEIYAQDGSDCPAVTDAGIISTRDISNITVPEDYELKLIGEGRYQVIKHVCAYDELVAYVDPTAYADGYWIYKCTCGETSVTVNEGTRLHVDVPKVEPENVQVKTEEGAEELSNDEIKAVIDHVVHSNAAVTDKAIFGEDANNAVIETMKQENPELAEEEPVLKVELTGMSIKTEGGEHIAHKMVFDVTPMLGDQKIELAAPITFHLPVDDAITAEYAYVYHEGQFLGKYAIQVGGGHKYVIVSSQDFSEFIVETDHVHTEKTVTGYGATCTEPGLTDGVECEVCGEVLSEQTPINPKNHNYSYVSNGDGTHTGTCANGCGIADNGTCDEDGTDGACSKCGYEATKTAEFNGVQYESLEEALKAAAKAGGGIVNLEKDVTVDEISVKDGVTLNLNGKVLTVEGYVLAAFNDSHIVDYSEGNTGRLVADIAMLRLLDNNAQLPVEMDDGIMFVDLKLNQGWYDEEVMYGFWFDKTETDAALIDALENGGTSAHNLKIQVLVKWTQNNLKYTYTDSSVALYVANWPDYAFQLKVYGAENVTNLTYQAKIVFAEGTLAQVVYTVDVPMNHPAA